MTELMENLVRHIEYLLLRHDCVLVPGIGAFINIYEKPEFDSESGKILPMRREVRFNAALRADDGLLANSFARKAAVSYREGTEMLGRAVAMLSSLLINEGEVTIGRIGLLRRECEGNLIFIPFMDADNLNTRLGFMPASILEHSADNTKSNIKLSIETGEPGGNTFPVIEETQLITRKLDFERNYYIPVNKMFVKACACLIVVFMIFVISVNNVSDSRINEERASVLPIDRIIDSAVGNSDGAHVPIEKSAPVKIETEAETLTATSGDISEDQPSCYLIVATFRNRNEAKVFIAGNSDKGYTLEIAPSATIFRVSAMSSSDRSQLFSELNSDSFSAAFPGGGWVWEK